MGHRVNPSRKKKFPKQKQQRNKHRKMKQPIIKEERKSLDHNQELILKLRAQRAMKVSEGLPSGQRTTDCRNAVCSWPFCMC